MMSFFQFPSIELTHRDVVWIKTIVGDNSLDYHTAGQMPTPYTGIKFVIHTFIYVLLTNFAITIYLM